MSNSFDPEKTKVHRLAEARAGFPLLRGSPNTSAISLCLYFDRIGQLQWTDFAEQFSEFIENDFLAPLDRLKRLEEFPLVEGHFRPILDPDSRRAKVRFETLPVKVVAGVMKDAHVGGLEGWARMIGQPEMDFSPAKNHAASLDEMVPVAPRRLRKLIDGMLVSRFGLTPRKVSSELISYETKGADGRLKIDVSFPRGGPGSADQLNYYFLREHPDGARVAMVDYESIWRIRGAWNYLTETNAERSITHFARLMEVCDTLV